MVYGTTVPPSNLPVSQWIDVASHQYLGHWVPEEGAAVARLLQELLGKGAKDIFLISPFRSVVQNLYSFSRNSKVVRTGTVHTIQGKEADIVILVLGGHPDKPGAKRWVSSKPNLLNVAVSRAKSRLYIIGNKQLWGPHPHIKEILEILDDNVSLV